MRLYEIAVVREIAHVPEQPDDGINQGVSTDPRDAVDTNRNIDGHKIYKVGLADGKTAFLLGKDSYPGPMATVIGTAYESSSDSDVALYIHRSFVQPQYRSRGVMGKFYQELRSMGYTLVSDLHLSPGSRKIWGRLIQNHPNKVYAHGGDAGDGRPASPADLRDEMLGLDDGTMPEAPTKRLYIER